MKKKKVLVLLLWEILEDPRVYKTCRSLCADGADVTVACTNPFRLPERESHEELSIVRFPHPREFVLKRLYNWLQSRLHPDFGKKLSEAHEEIPVSPIKSFVRNVILKMNHRHFTKGNLRVNGEMAAYFSGEAFDLVHCNDVETLHAGKILCRNGAAKLLYDSHEYWPGMGVHGSWTNKATQEAEAALIPYADYVVTVNSVIADKMKEVYSLERTPSVVMNCPYRFEEDTIFEDDVHSPARVIYQGKIHAFRGLPELVLAFKYIDNGVLTLSGYGALEEKLKLLVAAGGLTRKVIFAGRYSPHDALGILRGHDIGVMPFTDVTLNLKYSSPNKLFDYAMAGLSVAASEFPFLAKTVNENEMGQLFKEITPENIAETLNGMINNSELLPHYKRNARRAALDEFCWEEQWKHYPGRSLFINYATNS